MCISFHINNPSVLIGNLSQNFSNLFNIHVHTNQNLPQVDPSIQKIEHQ